MADCQRINKGLVEGKVAVPVPPGESIGIDLAAAELSTAEGAHVSITGRENKRIQNATIANGESFTAIQSDASNSGDLDWLFEAVRSYKRAQDVLFPGAGRGEVSVHSPDVAQLHSDHTFNLNVKVTLSAVLRDAGLNAVAFSRLVRTSLPTGLPPNGNFIRWTSGRNEIMSTMSRPQTIGLAKGRPRPSSLEHSG